MAVDRLNVERDMTAAFDEGQIAARIVDLGQVDEITVS